MAKRRQLEIPGFGPPSADGRLKARRDLSERAFLAAIKRHGFMPAIGQTWFVPATGDIDVAAVEGVFRRDPIRLDRRKTLARVAAQAAK